MLNLNRNVKQMILIAILGLQTVSLQAATITRGASGPDVKQVQEYLITQGYLLDKADGILGNNTAYSIKAFQKDMGLPVNGNVDEKTMQTLRKNNSKFVKKEDGKKTAKLQKAKIDISKQKLPNILLKKGDFTTEVHSAQVLLVKTGFLNDAADGIFGSNTVEAVKTFQLAAGLKVTGEIDGLTFVTLEEYYKNGLQKNEENITKDDAVKGNSQLAAKKEIKDTAKTVSNDDNFTSIIKVRKEGKEDSSKKELSSNKNKAHFARGDKHEELVELQEKLSVNGYSTNGIEGIFGQGTEKAVKAFQKDNGLKVTGKIDSKTKAKIKALLLKPKKYRRKFQVEATAYTGGIGCGEYTSNGHKLRRGYIAVDPKVIPLGTEVFIDGYGFAIADDIGGSIKGKTIDVAFNSHEEAIKYGRQKTTIYIL